jgi:hypothetical protein
MAEITLWINFSGNLDSIRGCNVLIGRGYSKNDGIWLQTRSKTTVMPCNELCSKLSLRCPENTKCKLVPNYCARERSKTSCNVLNRDGSGRNKTLQILQTSMNRDEDDYLLNIRANHVLYVPHNAV